MDVASRQPSGVERISKCRVEHWRGYVSSSFYALTDEGDVFESPTFRWRRAGPPPESTAARAAYDALVERLLAEGWGPEASGPPWYATRFTRSTLGPPPASDAASVAQPAGIVPDVAPVPPTVVPSPSDVVVAASSRPAAAADGAPPQRAPAARRWQERRVVLAGTLAGVLAFGGVAAVTAERSADARRSSEDPARATRLARAPAVGKAPGPLSGHEETSGATRRRASAGVVLAITARQPTWLEIRRGSEAGPKLYSGNLSPGRTLHFRGSRVWARFGAAGNLIIVEDGDRFRRQGTFDMLFVSHRGR